MSESSVVDLFTDTLFSILDETFEHVHGIYLDKGTSLFETLETVSAEMASRPVSTTCASIAAQVEHVRFYLQVLEDYMLHKPVGQIDWQASWRQQHVTPDEWAALKQSLKERYQHLLTVMKGFERWEDEDEIGGAMAIAIHTAYHLGEIRQALCTLR